MKKLMIPLVIAIVAGLGGGSAFSFVNAKNASNAAAAYSADSLHKHVQDSTAVADSLEKEAKANAEEAHAEEALMTPADSIRAVQSQPTTLKAATKDLTNAAEPKHGASAAADAHAPAPAGYDVAVVPTGNVVTPRAPQAARPPAATASSNEKGLPDSRIAKIFSAMQSKDAAKVLEQMSDNDIRVILTLMGDKQAAAILVALPAPRAAAISKGVAVKAVVKSDSTNHEKKPGGESL